MSVSTTPPAARPDRVRHRRATATRAGAALAVILAMAALAGCMTKDQTTDFNLVNGTRKAHHLALVKVSDPALSKAQKWSQHMAATGVLEHTGGGSTVSPAPLTGWCKYAENVGVGSSVQQVHANFLASPAHYANMTGPYNLVGTGVYKKNSKYWVTEIYLKSC